MKRILSLALIGALVGAPMVLPAEMDTKLFQGSAEFERMKALVGDWEASMPMEKGEEHSEMSEEHKKMMQKMRASPGRAGGCPPALPQIRT